MVRKIVVAVLLGFLTLHIMMIPAKAASTTNSSCARTQFSVVVKTATELKEKADQNSQTVKTYAKDKKLSVMKRSGNWYQICYEKKTAYLPIEDAREVFNVEEQAVLKQAEEKGNVDQVVSAIGKKLSSTKVMIRTYERRKGEWRRVFVEMKGIVGKNGLTINKKEGDGKSPIGMYAFGTAFGSQTKPSKLKLPYKKSTKYDYWIDDVKSKDYNKWVTFKGNPKQKWKSFERMNNELYKYGVVINYNTNPILKGKGSAIFLHIWRNENGVTAGCVATSEKNLLTILKWIDPKKNTQIIIGTKDTILDLPK